VARIQKGLGSQQLGPLSRTTDPKYIEAVLPGTSVLVKAGIPAADVQRYKKFLESFAAAPVYDTVRHVQNDPSSDIDLSLVAKIARAMNISPQSQLQVEFSQKLITALAYAGQRDPMYQFVSMISRKRHVEPALAQRITANLKSASQAGDDPVVMYYYGQLLESQGRIPEAKKTYQAALQLVDVSNSSIEALYQRGASIAYSLGSILFHQGRFDEAKPVLTRAANIDKDPRGCYLASRLIADFETVPSAFEKASQNCTMEWFNLLLRAAIAGHPKAAFAIGMFYLVAKEPAPEMLEVLREPRAYASFKDRIMEYWRSRSTPSAQEGPDSFRVRAAEKWLAQAARAYLPALLELSKLVVQSDLPTSTSIKDLRAIFQDFDPVEKQASPQQTQEITTLLYS